ncbi:MAG: ribbon-helix-helix protein, CopG family [Thermoanaerobaculia bacterium]|nr:ribbon-helix-helix protein, CopG family [Thermoanaerobaculia bacterium]
MASAMALRLDDQTKRRIARLAARRGTTRSALVREAIAALVEKEERQAAVRPHDLVRDLLGSVRGGDPDRSTDVGKKVRRMLKSRRPRR